LDLLATRYGVLPSFALQHGNTLDLTVLHVSAQYQAYVNETSTTEGKIAYNTKNHGKSQAELQEMLNKAKEKQKRANSQKHNG